MFAALNDKNYIVSKMHAISAIWNFIPYFWQELWFCYSQGLKVQNPITVMEIWKVFSFYKKHMRTEILQYQIYDKKKENNGLNNLF